MKHHSEKNRTKHEDEEDEPNIYTRENLLSFPTKVNNNNENNISIKSYEQLNVVSETGDSIYSSLSSSSIEDLDSGQIFYSVNAIRDIVRQELVAAGVLMKSEE